MWAYKKSHYGNSTVDYNSLESYLGLFINFKLKVLDAREMDFDKNPIFQEEVKTYESTLNLHKKAGNMGKDHDYLVNEYREGVLMFNVSELKIWNKAQDDEQALNNFYTKNQKLYEKPLEEIKGQVIADYQQKLEENWLIKLKRKYQVKINDNELKKLSRR